MEVMRYIIAVAILFSASALCQLGNLSVVQFPSAPTGACTNYQVALNTATGDYYDCVANAWLKVGPGGGGSGTVSSGTARQQAIYAASGTTVSGQTKPIIDVRDYGVDCTDTTDSTSAFASAVTAAGNFGKIIVPEGCIFKISGTPGIYLHDVYGLVIEFMGRQGNSCDNQGGNISAIDYRQTYASGNTVFSILDSQRLEIRNMTIYANGNADSGLLIDQDLSTPPITTRNDFYNVCILNNTLTRNASWKGINVSPVSTSNVENQHFYHPDITCSSSAATSATSNGVAINFGSSSNLKNEIVEDISTINCSFDVVENGGDNSITHGLASASYSNINLNGFNDELAGFRTENSFGAALTLGNSIGPHYVHHNDFASVNGTVIDCPATNCGTVTLINNETDTTPTDWFNVHGGNASGALFAFGNRNFSFSPFDFGVSTVCGYPYTISSIAYYGCYVGSLSGLVFGPPVTSTAAQGTNNPSSPIDLRSDYLTSGTVEYDDYFLQQLPAGVWGSITDSTFIIGHDPASTIQPWFAFLGKQTGATYSQITATPAIDQIQTRGTAGTTSYTYEIVAHGSTGHTAASAGFTISTGNAVLSSTNYNVLYVHVIAGCAYFDVYRTASGGTPSSTGLIGHIPCYVGQPNGTPFGAVPGFQFGGSAASQLYFNDQGLAGDSSVPPTGNTTGQLLSSTLISAGNFGTATNCAAVGTAANPSVVSCSAAPAGSFSCATNASGGTCTVNTTAVTANSEIFITQRSDTTTGTRLGVTCNATLTTAIPEITAVTAGTSFTINLGTITTNPECFSYFLVN